jgi:chromate transporter
MAKPISLTELFLGFLKIGMLGFGGVAPVARHVIVVERKWLTEAEFAALRGYGTVLPGPNVTNMAVMLGFENQGWLGALTAALGIMLVPLLFMLVLAVVYDDFRDHPMVADAVYAMAAA